VQDPEYKTPVPPKRKKRTSAEHLAKAEER
jgi:hypothetical protein